MASIRKRKGKFTITINVPKDYPYKVYAKTFSKTFNSKKDALFWARHTHDSMKLGSWRDPRLLDEDKEQDTLFKDVLNRYLKEVSVHKKGHDKEIGRIKKYMAHLIGQKFLYKIKSSDIADIRDELLKQGKAASTVRNEIFILSNVFQVAKFDWGYSSLENPVEILRQRKNSLPKPAPGRERRLEGDEEYRLMEAIEKGHDSHEMKAIIIVALETGMRLGEILGAKRAWLKGDVLSLPDTKNGTNRDVILSPKALDAIQNLHLRLSGDIFGLNKDKVEYRWKMALREAEISNLRIHDLRHEALSRMVAKGANLKIIMRQSGHKSVDMLMRYTHPTNDDVRKMLVG
ncbi:site-specific integrase [Thalassospira sp. HJ]|uniref:integrase n=1 Tax=Thalassospira sp. HJ TaxID=1616823 RepID=UPI000696BF6D|nr:site-specific integrase [Thalassospira sp. HJ]